MAQQLSPFLEGKYGWNFGESGWNTGMDENLLKFSFMFDRNVDSITADLPSAVNGQAHYLTTDNRIYFAVGSVYYSTPVPKYFIITVRTTGQTHQFNGTSLVQIDTPAQTDSRLDAVELTISTLGTAAFEDVADLATQAELDVVSSQANSYTDTLRSDLAAATGSTLVGYSSRTVEDKLSEVVSVLDFGAVGDGVEDDTAAIQAAINSTSNKIVSPAGLIFKITDTLTINRSNLIIDLDGSEVLLNDPSGIKTHLFIGDGVTQRSNVKIRNVIFSRQQAAVAGYAIDTNFVGVVDVQGCRIYGNNEIWRGIRIYRGIIVNIQNNYIDNCLDRGIYLIGTDSSTNRTIDVSIRENRIEGGVVALETSDFVEGVFCRDNIFFNTSNSGIIVDATSDANGLISFKFQDNDFDTCGGSGLYIDKVSNFQVNGCWFSSNTGDDIQLKEFATVGVVVGNQIYPNANGINCFGSSYRISDNLISGGVTAINLNAAASRIDISSNTLSNAQNGVNLSTATNTHLVGNSLYNISTTPVIGVGGSGTVVQNNKGDAVVGTTSSVVVGASPFTYTAGPRQEYVSVFGGTVSNISVGATSVASNTDRSVVLAPNQSVTITYTVAPTVVSNTL